MLCKANPIPLALYIHIPWCIKKCPYCDFNSYAKTDALPEDEYITALIKDLDQDLSLIQSKSNRPLTSIFFGGGTPSLFSGKSIASILNAAEKRLAFAANIEITLEANPGTIEHTSFSDYHLAGINRISLGAQSFQDDKLKALGRVHSAREIHLAIESIQKANFNSFNIDLMYGLPNQSLADAKLDLETALQYEPKHLSWYHLTIEQNTVFHHCPPPLPDEELTWDMQNMGFACLASAGMTQYEVSAFAKPGYESRHNINYWKFGDYLGIGAGAHGKITTQGSHFNIQRTAKKRLPKSYMAALNEQKLTIPINQQNINNPAYQNPANAEHRILNSEDKVFEFMLNALRLSEGFSIPLFEQRTGLSFSLLESQIQNARLKNLLCFDQSQNQFKATDLGKRFLNDLILEFGEKS